MDQYSKIHTDDALIDKHLCFPKTVENFLFIFYFENNEIENRKPGHTRP